MRRMICAGSRRRSSLLSLSQAILARQHFLYIVLARRSTFRSMIIASCYMVCFTMTFSAVCLDNTVKHTPGSQAASERISPNHGQQRDTLGDGFSLTRKHQHSHRPLKTLKLRLYHIR